MERYQPPDDPSNDPTRYADYGAGPEDPYGSADGYGAGAAPPAEAPPTPWYLKPAVLMTWGALVAILLAAVIWGIVELASRNSGYSTPTTSSSASSTTTTTTTTTTAPVAPAPITTTTEPTTTTTTTTETTSETTTTTTSETTTVPTTTTTSEGGFRLPHVPSQITLPPLPTVIDLPPGL